MYSLCCCEKFVSQLACLQLQLYSLSWSHPDFIITANRPMNKPIVVYIGPDSGWQAIQATVGTRATFVHANLESESVARALRSADGLVDAAIRIPISDGMIASATNLKVISCASTGTDHVARGEITKRGIIIRSLRDSPRVIQNLTPAAELSWALVLACARKLPAAITHVRDGGWDREQFPGLMLNGRCLGLIGCGRIGGWMARYGQAFGMTVKGYDPHVRDWPRGVTPIQLDELMRTSDVISVHVPLNDETIGLVSSSLIKITKPGAILINTSRGAIVDEAALLDALQSGRIGAAGLDVLAGEPHISDHPLLRYARQRDNLLITPHCGGFSPDAVAKVSAHAAQVALAVIQKSCRS
jgi:phosphoglycerate dehydrogenase-like enzyme